ncbi:MAG: peptidase M61 [Bacteroidota bacterium]
MKKLFSAILFAALCPVVATAKLDTCRISLDLDNVVSDMVKVTIHPPKIKEKSVMYVIPAIIPGTYANSDFVRFLSDVRAYDATGNELTVEREDDNQVRIVNAQKLSKIEYWVNDSWDDTDSAKYIFPPGGTNIQEDKNFVINHAGFYGYFEGYKMNPYAVTVTKPAGLYGATSLSVTNINATTDVLKAPNYVFLADNPVMYSAPDTVSFMEGKTKINVAVYSPKPTMNAKKVSGYLRPLASAIKGFLGEMPVDHYTFIFYFLGEKGIVSQVKGWGALEHSYSSMYFLPLTPNEEQTKELISSSAVHEFLHILVPLNLHSEEIGDFNYRTPKMSQHLWLYEGTTEYFASLAQVQGGIITEDEFLNDMRRKVMSTENLEKPLSLITLSKRVLEPEYEKLYPIIYEKGAVTAMLLDIRLRELSGGKTDLLKLVNTLTQKYGPDKPFKDNELIDVIVKMTYPEIGQFFTDYIIGDKPLPYREYFAKMGWNFESERMTKKLGFGKTQLEGAMENGKLALMLTPLEENAFGIQRGDQLVQVNGEELSPMNGQKLMGTFMNPVPDTEVEITVKRNGELLKLKAKPSMRDTAGKNILEKNPDATEMQSKLNKQLIYRQ